MYSSVQPKHPVQQLSRCSKCAVQSELLGSSQEDGEVKEQNPSGYWDSEQEVKASISSQELKIYMHTDPYNCRHESKKKIFMGPEGCNFLKINFLPGKASLVTGTAALCSALCL